MSRIGFSLFFFWVGESNRWPAYLGERGAIRGGTVLNLGGVERVAEAGNGDVVEFDQESAPISLCN